jgi:hypothetical protein
MMDEIKNNIFKQYGKKILNGSDDGEQSLKTQRL